MSVLRRLLVLCVLAGAFLVASFAGNLVHSILASVPHGTLWLWAGITVLAALGIAVAIRRRRRTRRSLPPGRA